MVHIDKFMVIWGLYSKNIKTILIIVNTYPLDNSLWKDQIIFIIVIIMGKEIFKVPKNSKVLILALA